MSSYVSRVVKRGVCPVGRSISGVFAAPVISVPAAIPDYDGLLPVTALAADLEVNLPWWDGVTEGMRLQAAWKLFMPGDPNDPDETNLVGEVYVVTAADEADSSTVFKLYVPKDLLVHGIYLLRVRSRSTPGAVIDWSQRFTVRVDTIAPGTGALPLLEFPGAVVEKGSIDDSDIVDDSLPVWLAHYDGIARGDRIELYIDNTPVTSMELDQEPANYPDFIPFFIPLQDLEDAGNGVHFFSYKVTDKAGNFDSSHTEQFDVQLHTTPTTIPAPTVPQADEDLLDDAEARAGTKVYITQYDLAQAGDEIMVHWGSQVSLKFPLQTSDLPNHPLLIIDLSYALVAAETLKGDVDVTFEVFRKGNSIGTSLIDTVTVDLTLPGGPDPDPETPELETLLPLTVRSFSNTGTPPPGPADNIIPPQDFDKNATAYIPWLDKDGKDIYALGDVIELTWGSQTATKVNRSIVQKDLDAKVDLQLTVPGTTITAEGSGTDILVGYTISRIVSPPSTENTAIAVPTPVDVTGPEELPGEGTIDDVKFTVLNEDDAIGQAQLIGPAGSRYNPVQTRVDYTNVEAGDTVQLFFSGYDRLTGGNLIPAADYKPTYTLTQSDIDKGTYDFNVPATYHFAVCSRGHVEAYVVFTNAKGSAQSSMVSAYCDVKFPNDPDCSTYMP